MGTLVINKIHLYTIPKKINSTTINEFNKEVLRKQLFFSVNKEGFSESSVYGALKYIRKQTLDCLFFWHNGCQVWSPILGTIVYKASHSFSKCSINSCLCDPESVRRHITVHITDYTLMMMEGDGITVALFDTLQWKLGR